MVLYGLTKNCGCDKSLKKGVFFRLSPTLTIYLLSVKMRMENLWNITRLLSVVPVLLITDI